MQDSVLTYLLEDELTYNEFIRELVQHNLDNAVPLPLVPKLMELFFRDWVIKESGDSPLDYMSFDTEQRFFQLAFGRLTSAQQAHLFTDLYNENQTTIDGHIEVEASIHIQDKQQYWKEFHQESYKDIKEMSLGGSL